jgi:hypothetical protein
LAKIREIPVRFSAHFGVSPDVLAKVGVLDVTLNVDTALFIDPLLLPTSRHEELSAGATATYKKHFELVIKLLRASKRMDDVAWRGARELMEFPEAKWTCLGYGAHGTAGSGSGPYTTNAVMQTAKEIVDMGIEDPDLFVALGVFEEGIGPDRIGDMATNVIMEDLLAFNRRVLAELEAPTTDTVIALRNGRRRFLTKLAMNPFGRGETGIVLVPTDIVRALPIAKDWSEISDAADKGRALRAEVNQNIGRIWRSSTLKEKRQLRDWALSSGDAFDDLLQSLKHVKPEPYDIARDPAGELTWRRVADALSAGPPYVIAKKTFSDANDVAAAVDKIIEGFRFLVEERRLSEELYAGGKVRPEKSAQRLFYVSAYWFCKANNLDITPEADTGNGPVDFKIALGFEARVLVEIKLSTNSKLVAGYTRQLETYKGAEETTKGFYVVLDVGGMGDKLKQLIAKKNEMAKAGRPVSPIVVIDGTRRPSASKLK